MYEIKLMYSFLIYGIYKLLERNDYMVNANFIDLYINFCFSLLIIDTMFFNFV